MSKEIDICRTKKGYWSCIQGVILSAWSGADWRLCVEIPHSYVAADAADIQCGEYHRVFEREISDTDIQGVSASETEFHRPSFLGKRLLCKHCRIRWSENTLRTRNERKGVRSSSEASSGGFHYTTRSVGGFGFRLVVGLGMPPGSITKTGVDHLCVLCFFLK